MTGGQLTEGALTRWIKLLIGQPKYRYLKKEFGPNGFSLLDVGGGEAVQEVKGFFPDCAYYCIDQCRTSRFEQLDAGFTRQFWAKDLTQLAFDDIPDGFFDAITMTHVIEHLPNGDHVLRRLLPKLKKGGVIYIEYPGRRSTRLPSAPGTLNFHDDPTHCRIYDLPEIEAVLAQERFQLVRSGVRRTWARILLMPLLVPYKLIKSRESIGYEFWDLLGFAEFAFARKLT